MSYRSFRRQSKMLCCGVYGLEMGRIYPAWVYKCGTEDTKWVDHPDQWLGFCDLPTKGLSYRDGIRLSVRAKGRRSGKKPREALRSKPGTENHSRNSEHTGSGHYATGSLSVSGSPESSPAYCKRRDRCQRHRLCYRARTPSSSSQNTNPVSSPRRLSGAMQ